jgi:peptidoglycan hydrolase-like protein with peptidoglycan-binding domain
LSRKKCWQEGPALPGPFQKTLTKSRFYRNIVLIHATAPPVAFFMLKTNTARATTMQINLNKPFAANAAVDEGDVRQMKRALNRLGYYQPNEKTGITGTPDHGIFHALRDFQKDHGLPPTGTAKPEDDAMKTLNNTPAQQSGGQYIWRTAGDDKVRDAHAALDETVRDFADSPSPGEDFNCRCWAEPVSSQRMPIPPRKPNCNKEKEAYQEAKQKIKELESRKEKLLEEIGELREKLKELGEKMIEILGINMSAFIITIPINKLDFLAELLRRYFGNIISSELLETADRLAKERGARIREAEHKMDQLKIVMAQFKQSAQILDRAKATLEKNARQKFPGIRMIKAIHSKILAYADWKVAFKDLAKFYIYLVLFYGLAAFLVWGYAYMDLEMSKISLDQTLSDPLNSNFKIKEFNFETHEIIAKQMGQYIFTLVCFGVFFATPPKKFKHIAIVTVLISLTANTPFLYESLTEWLSDSFYLCGNVLAAWICSHIWLLFKHKMLKQKPGTECH